MSVEKAVTDAASLLAKADVDHMIIIARKGNAIYRISSFIDDEEMDRFFHHVVDNGRITGAVYETTVYEATPDGLKKIQEKSDDN